MEPQITVSMKYLKHQKTIINFFFKNSICHTFFGRLSVYNSRVLVCLVVVQSVKNVSSGYNAILTGNDQLWTFIGVCNVWSKFIWIHFRNKTHLNDVAQRHTSVLLCLCLDQFFGKNNNIQLKYIFKLITVSTSCLLNIFVIVLI